MKTVLSPSLPVVWLSFALCVALIGYAGSKLSRYGDVIADKTGLGGTWIGLILVATVTSLPELVTGLSAVTLAQVPDIAVGNILGACVINLAMIVVLDLLDRGELVYSRASQGHILSAGFGTILIGFIGFNVLFAQHERRLSLGHVGAYTPIIMMIYAIAMLTVFRYERKQRAEFVEERVERYPDVTLRQAIWRYAGASVLVVGAGIALPFVGAALADAMGWHQTFVGTLLVAFATTLPEMAVTVSALRIGALDMAVSNLLGSNLFNIFLIAIDDLAFVRGPLLSHVSPLHVVSALSAVIMNGIAIVGLFYRPRVRVFRTVGWASLCLLAVYLLNSFILYLYTQ